MKKRENKSNYVDMETYEDAEEIMDVVRKITKERSEQTMDKKVIEKILSDYAKAMEGKKSKAGIATRKSALKKILQYNFFTTRKDFEETITDNPKYSRFIKELRKVITNQKDFEDSKNAISIYAELVLHKSIYTPTFVIKDALENYALAVEAFDHLSEFSTVNIVGEYGELIMCRAFDLDRAFTNKKSIDATFVDTNGIERGVQIKTRWHRHGDIKDATIEFGSVKENEIDYFIGLILGPSFEVEKCIILSKDNVIKCLGTRKKRAIIYTTKFEEQYKSIFETTLNNKKNKWCK